MVTENSSNNIGRAIGGVMVVVVGVVAYQQFILNDTNECREGYDDVAGVCWQKCNGVDTGGLCRPRCRDGYTDVAGVCWRRRPSLRSYVPPTRAKKSYVEPTRTKHSYVKGDILGNLFGSLETFGYIATFAVIAIPTSMLLSSLVSVKKTVSG
jgi:hypothetical protein